MGERKGTNKYYPPDFDWKKHGSLDKYHNSHPLRERARKLGEGILIIRIEMPYNVWCNGCNKHIGMGVRYNAEKMKVGNYYSTPIYKFRMKCHLCPQYFELQTDPAKCEYVLLSGARRKEERWSAKDNEQIEMTDHLDKKKLATDPMFKLEHGVKDQKKLASAIPTLEEIQDLQEEKKDDYILNKILRNKFRAQKRSIETVAKEDQALLSKSSLDIKLVPEDESDKNLAKLMKHSAVKSFEENRADIRREISSKPVLETTSPTIEVKKVTAKLPKSLGSVLVRSAVKHNVWGGKNDSSKSSSNLQKTLGIKVVKRKSSDSGKMAKAPPNKHDKHGENTKTESSEIDSKNPKLDCKTSPAQVNNVSKTEPTTTSSMHPRVDSNTAPASVHNPSNGASTSLIDLTEGTKNMAGASSTVVCLNDHKDTSRMDRTEKSKTLTKVNSLVACYSGSSSDSESDYSNNEADT